MSVSLSTNLLQFLAYLLLHTPHYPDKRPPLSSIEDHPASLLLVE